MVGLKQRKRVEGWAVNTPGFGGEIENAGLRQRLADNNKLWIFSLVAIILITGFLIHKTKQVPAKGESNYTDKYQANADAPYYDIAHQKFANEFKTYKSSGSVVLDAAFVGAGSFQVIVPSDVSADEVEYMANLAGMMAMHRLKERIVVNVYYGKASDSSPDATASFDPKRNGFVVKFKDSGTSPDAG